MDIKHIIESLGYEVQKHGNYFKTKAFWRGGNDINSVTIYPKENRIIDHVEGQSYDLKAFLKLVLKKNDKELNEWLEEKKLELPKPQLDTSIKNEDFEFNLDYLLPDYTYWINRGIKENTCKTFLGGKCLTGKMKDRQILNIFNSQNCLIGVVGRTLINSNLKYKILGDKSKFVFPAYLNHNIIKETREVILVESPVCCMKLWDSGIQNSLCLFGVELGLGVLNFLIKINPRKIIISTNNEQSLIGNNAAIKIEKKLKKYFDSDIIEIKLPLKKDFADMDRNEIIKWKSNG